MGIFEHIDQDKALSFMAFYWWVPFRAWFYGIPEEPMFLHELFQRHRRHGHAWDVGLRARAMMTHQVARLHQQGSQRTDEFGSDFALTIDVSGALTFRKTVVIQTKLGDHCSAIVERRQLDQVLAVSQFAGRAFTLAMDRTRHSLRLVSVDELAQAFPVSSGATKTFDTAEWMSSSEWIVRWMSCKIGRPSTSLEAASIEGLLARHVLQAPDDFPRYERSDRREDEETFVPPVWYHTSLTIND